MYERTKTQWYEVLKGITSGCVPDEGKSATYESGFAALRRLREIGAWKPQDRVLDVGSGNGRLTIPLTEQPGSYLGIEPMEACIEFCRSAFAPWEHIQFEHVNLRNAAYNPQGELAPEGVEFPVSDESCDVVLFYSVFTHAASLSVCARNLAETRRVLKPGGKCWTTWFASPPNQESSDARRTVFRMRDIVDLMVGWKWRHSDEGLTSGYHDQWSVLLEKC